MSILFLKDWKNEEGKLRAIIHVTTKNTSFLRTAALLRKLGCKNYAFPLALYDPDLKNIDVHDLEEDTVENEILRTKVQIEARRNVWYYLRECIRIYEQGGAPVKFRLDRSSTAMTWCFINGIDYCGMAPRQTGKTVCALSLISWVMYSSGYEYVFGGFAKDNKLREENVKRVRAFGENLPNWWISEDKFKDKKNTTELFYSGLRTHYVTMVAQKDQSAADNQARGASMPAIHIDELEYCASIGISYATMLASTGAARENAKKNGKPHSNLITTTAGDPTKPECQQATKILSGAMAFSEFLYDLEHREKVHEVIQASSPQKMVIGVFSHLQLGYDNNWLRDKFNRNRMTKDQLMRDYLNKRVSIQEEPIIPKDVLAKINDSESEHNHMQILNDKFVIFWYISEEIRKSQAFKERPIVVGCDSSEMIDRDATTLVGIDPTTLETVFTFRCSEGNINKVGAMIAQLLLMFPKMLLVPENKSSGTAFIDNVSLTLRRHNQNPFYRMFNWVVNNRRDEEFARVDLRNTDLLDTSIKKYFGIKTDKSKRDELYGSTLLDGAQRACTKIRDKVLIQELNSLTVRNGRVDHAVGGHDDTVFSWMLAMWTILNGKNLDLYGIKPGTVLSRTEETSDDRQKAEQAEQDLIRQRIEALEKAARVQKDPSLRKLIESDITMFKSMISQSGAILPQTADDFNRDPRRFIDPEVAKEARKPVYTEDFERSLKALMRIN